MSELKLFDNGTDWVVAFDKTDADVVWEQHTMEDSLQYNHKWEEDISLQFTVMDEPLNGKTTMSTKEWCLFNGRGFLCSREY